jgi:hypothetical protein
MRVRLENLLVEGTELLRLVDERAGIQFSKLGQFRSLLYFCLCTKRAPGRRHT